MSEYYKYKKEKFIEKYKSAVNDLDDLKEAIKQYRASGSKIVRRAMFAYFQDFSEYIIDMCESYIIINDGKVDSSTSAIELIDKSHDMGFFDDRLKDDLIMAIKLRNRYTHDYYKRSDSEKQIEEFCYNKLCNLEIFLDESKENVILMYKTIEQ